MFCHYIRKKNNQIKRILATSSNKVSKRQFPVIVEMKMQYQKDRRVLVKFFQGLTLETRFNKVHSLQFIHFSDHKAKILK